MDANFRFETAPRHDHDAEVHASEPARARQVAAAKHNARETVVEFGSGWYHDAAIASDKGSFAHPYR